MAANAGFVLAQEENGSGGGGFAGLLIWVLIGAAVWFFLLGPQRRRMKSVRAKQQELRETLQFGDDIVTVGGIFGRVITTTEHDVTVDIGGGVEIRITRRAIAERIGDGEE